MPSTTNSILVELKGSFTPEVNKIAPYVLDAKMEGTVAHEVQLRGDIK